MIGVEFFRQRIHTKLVEMFVFDDRHYIAMCLHPASREMGKRNLLCCVDIGGILLRLFILLDGVFHQIKTNCYGNIRRYLQDEMLQCADATTTDHVPSSKKRKILHRFLDEEDDHEGKT